jgi:hypothetical protein
MPSLNRSIACSGSMFSPFPPKSTLFRCISAPLSWRCLASALCTAVISAARSVPWGRCWRCAPALPHLQACRRFSEDCGTCRHCHTICRMGAIDRTDLSPSAECILCLDCLSHCPKLAHPLYMGRSACGRPGMDLSRRAVLASLAAGALAPLALPSRPLARHPDPLS